MATHKLATLTPEEEKLWEFTFAHYVGEGLKDDEADYIAWKEMQQAFPRLKGFWGCRA